MIKIKFGLIATLALCCFLAIGCGSSSDEDAMVRVVHGSPDAPNVDVLVDDEIVLENVPYNVASEYLNLDTGSRNFKVNAAGTDVTVINADVEVQEGVSYTVIASSLLESITPIVLVDDRDMADEGSVKVRAIHNAVSAPEVDIYVTAPEADISDIEPTLSGVPYTGVSDYLTVPAGNYQVRVTIAGTKTVAIDSGAVMLESTGVYSILAQDATGGGAPFQFLVLRDS